MSTNTATSQSAPRIDVASILGDILKRWWCVVLTAAAAALLAFSYVLTVPSYQYTSSAAFLISTGSATVLQNNRSITAVASTLTGIISSDVLRRMVRAEIGSVAYTANASLIENTNIMTLTVTTDDARSSFVTLKAVNNATASLLKDVMADVKLLTLEQPIVATHPNNSYNVVLYTAVGGIIGALLCMAGIAFFSYLRDTIKNKADARQKVNARLLGTVPYVPRKRKATTANLPMLGIGPMRTNVMENYQIIAAQIINHLQSRGAQVLMITSVLPNEGKSTVSLNLAATIARNGYRTLFMDGDFFNPSCAALLGVKVEDEDAIYQAMKDGHYNIEKMYQDEKLPLYGLLGGKRSSNAGKELSNGQFARLLDAARRDFEYIIVDSSPIALVSDTEILQRYCDATALVVAQDAAVTRSINDGVRMLNRGKKLVGCIYRQTKPESHSAQKSYGYYGKHTTGVKADQ